MLNVISGVLQYSNQGQTASSSHHPGSATAITPTFPHLPQASSSAQAPLRDEWTRLIPATVHKQSTGA